MVFIKKFAICHLWVKIFLILRYVHWNLKGFNLSFSVRAHFFKHTRSNTTHKKRKSFWPLKKHSIEKTFDWNNMNVTRVEIWAQHTLARMLCDTKTLFLFFGIKPTLIWPLFTFCARYTSHAFHVLAQFEKLACAHSSAVF